MACFRQPHEGEVVKMMNCGEMISLMQKDYPSLQNTVGNKVRLGKTISALGFKHKEHSHVAYYEVVPLKAAWGVMGEMKERNGRDENNLSHAETPFYKGIPSEYGRDEGFLS